MHGCESSAHKSPDIFQPGGGKLIERTYICTFPAAGFGGQMARERVICIELEKIERLRGEKMANEWTSMEFRKKSSIIRCDRCILLDYKKLGGNFSYF